MGIKRNQVELNKLRVQIFMPGIYKLYPMFKRILINIDELRLSYPKTLILRNKDYIKNQLLLQKEKYALAFKRIFEEKIMNV